MKQVHNPARLFDRLRCRFKPFCWVIAVIAAALTDPCSVYPQSRSRTAPTVTKDARGRKFVNKIPYDVFFDRPLEMVQPRKGDGTSSGSKAADTTAQTLANPLNDQSIKPNQAEDGKTDTKSNGGGVAPSSGQSASEIQWNELLSMDDLQGEIKALRNRLSNHLKTQAQFRQNFKSIATDGFEIAALGIIAGEHRDSGNWKANSQYIREFGTQLGRSSAGMSKNDFEAAKLAFQKLSSLLDGSIPADAGDVPPKRPFHDAASRKELMRRIERARDWLQKDVNSESKLKSNSDAVQREAAILAALAAVVTTSGYEYTENDDYKSFARQLIEGAREAAEAGRDDAFPKFKHAIEKINKSCTDCHGNYGNG